MNTPSHSKPLPPILGTLLLAAALWSFPGRTHAQLYVATYANGGVGEYNATTGAAINTNFIPPTTSNAQSMTLSGNDLYVGSYGAGPVTEYNATTGATIASFSIAAYGLAVSGNNLYVSNASGTVGEYNATTGAAISSSFITGLNEAETLAVSGNNLYILYYSGSYKVGEFDATTGASVGGFTTISGLLAPSGLAISGNNLYIAYDGSVGEYNATTGAAVDATLMSGLPTGFTPLAVTGNDLYVGNTSNDTVGEYNATTGATIAGFSTITNSGGYPWDLAVGPNAAPEPGSITLVALGVGALAGWRRRRSP